MRLVLISDTHGYHRELKLPLGDILIHAGDLFHRGDLAEVNDFNAWLASLPFAYKIIVAGNHDFCFEHMSGQALVPAATYLQDSAITIEGIKFYGSPWQPRFFDWAFNLDRGQPLKEKWDLIPDDTQVLITHSPPWQIQDRVMNGTHVGCQDLLHRLRTVNPYLHVFGHIHESYGMAKVDNTLFVNASTCNIKYRAVNPAIVIDTENWLMINEKP